MRQIKAFILALFFFMGVGSWLAAIQVNFHWKNEHEGILKVFLDAGEAVCDSSIKLSIDDPGRSLRSWEVFSDNAANEEYVVPLKSNKLLYRKLFKIKLSFDRPLMEDVYCHWSCFVVEQDNYREERIVPFFKKILLRAPPIKRKEIKKKLFMAPLREALSLVKKKRGDSSPRALNTNILLLLFLILFFLGFLLVQVLRFSDIAGFLTLGGFILFGRIVLPYVILLLSGAVGLLVLAAFMFRKDESAPTFLRSVRSVLGFLCGASVLPLLVEAYLVLLFG